MRSIGSISFAVFVLTLAVAPASAQSVSLASPTVPMAAAEQGGTAARPQTRSGFWFSGGLGFGSLGCEDCDTREGSLTADLSAGGTLSDRLLIGAGTSAWSKEEDGVTLTAATLEARVRFYPRVQSGFFVTGGLGLGSIRLAVDDFDDDTERGLGLTLGVGWDLRVGRNVSITPYWTGTAVSAGDGDANFGALGVAVTIH